MLASRSTVRVQTPVSKQTLGGSTSAPAAPLVARNKAAPLSSVNFLSNTASLKNVKHGVSMTQATRFDRETALSTVAGLFGPKKKTVIITGASSGLGKAAAKSLMATGDWYVVMACRNVDKAEEVAQELEFPKGSYEVMDLQLDDFDSVRDFVKRFRKGGRQLDCLLCNAAVYLPNQPAPTYTVDGFEESMQVNHLSHFLLCRLMLPDLKKSKSKDKRMIIVGSITGNTNTVGGGAVAPFADLGDLSGLAKCIGGKKEPMADGKGYNGAKAYKDSKLANMMTVLQLHDRYHESTGITFTSMYPGCIAETALFRQKRGWFRWFFPIFMKYVTGGYVGEEEAGDRLASCVADEDTKESGVYWSWNGGARAVARWNGAGKPPVGAGGSGGSLFKNLPSKAVRDPEMGQLLWELSCNAVGVDDGEEPSAPKKGNKKQPVMAR